MCRQLTFLVPPTSFCQHSLWTSLSMYWSNVAESSRVWLSLYDWDTLLIEPPLIYEPWLIPPTPYSAAQCHPFLALSLHYILYIFNYNASCMFLFSTWTYICHLMSLLNVLFFRKYWFFCHNSKQTNIFLPRNWKFEFWWLKIA